MVVLESNSLLVFLILMPTLRAMNFFIAKKKATDYKLRISKPGNVENEKIISGINPIFASSSLSPRTVFSKKNALCGITISTTITRYVATVIKQVNWPIT